jgi:hypothetical protein
MSEKRRMTLPDLLCHLRERLIEARERNDQESLVELKTTFTILREVSYSSEDEKLITLVVALEDSARDAIMSVPWKSDIPSVETIRSALSDQS